MTRHLVGLIDGTRVSASRVASESSYSNVFELACLLQLQQESETGDPQIVFYTSGISSQPDNSSFFNLATGNSIMSQIIDQYTNICSNFDFKAAADGKPDKIYLIGFSRGAMAIRALAGLIAEFGLLEPRHIYRLPEVLDAWSRSIGKSNLTKTIDLQNVEVEFVGLFDSVMGGVEWLSIFNPIRFKHLELPARCRNAVQILAIDENRPHFKHKFWDGAEVRETDKEFEATRNLRQVWMPGVHSDVGGTGNPIWGNASFLAMTFFIEKYTHLAINKEELVKKEYKFREASRVRKYFIEPHRGLFNKYKRGPINSPQAGEWHHPICSALQAINFAGMDRFAWHDRIFNQRFPDSKVDPDLESYFAQVIGGGQSAVTSSASYTKA